MGVIENLSLQSPQMVVPAPVLSSRQKVERAFYPWYNRVAERTRNEGNYG